MSKKLDVLLERQGRRIVGEVIYQDDIIKRGDGTLIKKSGYSIVSVSSPELQCRSLYIRGTNRSRDIDTFDYIYNTVDEAFEAYHHLLNLIDELNEM